MSVLKKMSSHEQMEEALKTSHARFQLLFKHSNTCPISASAFRALQQHLASDGLQEVDYWLIVVQEARSVSNEIASRLGVKHESPQAILVKAGEAVWDASHFEITPVTLLEAVTGRF